MKEQIDMRCLCKRCEARTQETCILNVRCGVCNWSGTALMRKGDHPSPSYECPRCGCTRLLMFTPLPEGSDGTQQ